jgi:hypothetical protein
MRNLGHPFEAREQGKSMNTELIDRAIALSEAFESKVVRHVATPAGVRRFNQPIGSIIVRDRPLKNISIVGEHPYDGWTLVKDKSGKEYSVGQDEDSGKWIATEGTDGWDAVVEADSEDEIYDALDSKVGGGKGKRPAGKNPNQIVKGKKKVTGVPADWDVSYGLSGDGRLIIRGTDSEGRKITGYQTIAGQWIAKYDGEIQKSDGLASNPREALDKLQKRNSTGKYKSKPTPKGTFHRGPSSATSSNAGEKKPELTAKQRAEVTSLSKNGKLEYDDRVAEGYTHSGAIVRAERVAKLTPKQFATYRRYILNERMSPIEAFAAAKKIKG